MTNSAHSPDQPPSIAPLWRRFAATIVDFIVLGAPTVLFGMLFFQTAAGLGSWGRLIGFVAATVYFALLDSHVGLGQTIGKRMAEIRVVGRTGELLGVPRAAARFLVIGIPWYLSGAYFDFGDALPRWALTAMGVLIEVVVFGGIGAILYLFVFNRRTGQSLHDLAVDSFVVLESRAPAPVARVTARLHYVVVGCWIALMLIGGGGFAWYGSQPDRAEQINPLIELQAAIRQDTGLSRVGVKQGSTMVATIGTGTRKTKFLQVTVDAGGNNNIEALKRTVARAVLTHHPDLLGQELLIVHIRYGFDFWVATWTADDHEALTATEWQSKLALSDPGTASPTNARVVP